ncbi:MAG: pyridoxamine 5'-phosphate oxidase family protein [Chloroflexi bacterium]|nr:pyridoxamine 5'-phosphate oxidase family protein [Chloroflexota bacterium]
MAIELPEEFQTAINNAFTDGFPIIWTSAGANGQPSLAFFGTTQAYSDHEVAIWMRTTNRGFLARIEENPQVAMMYRNAPARLTFQIHGEAHRVDDPAVKKHVYEHSAEAEQKADPDRLGTAVIVDVVRVIQRGQVIMARDGDTGSAD